MTSQKEQALDVEGIRKELGAEAAQPSRFTPFTLKDLYEQTFPPARWLAKDLIPLGGITALTGEPASYKTFLMQHLAACVAHGEPFLGHFKVEKGNVLVVDEENRKRQIRERYEAMDVPTTSGVLFLSETGLKIDNEDDMDELLKIAEIVRPTLIILDSFVRLHSGEENSAT